MPASTNTIKAPLKTDWVEGASPLNQLAGPDCRLKIQPVTSVAPTPPTIMARICWSLNGFFIAPGPRLAGVRGAPHHGDALCARQLDQDLGRRQTEDGAGGIAFDDIGAGAGAVRRRIRHRDPLHAFGDREIGRDIAACADAKSAADGAGSL